MNYQGIFNLDYTLTVLIDKSGLLIIKDYLFTIVDISYHF